MKQPWYILYGSSVLHRFVCFLCSDYKNRVGSRRMHPQATCLSMHSLMMSLCVCVDSQQQPLGVGPTEPGGAAEGVRWGWHGLPAQDQGQSLRAACSWVTAPVLLRSPGCLFIRSVAHILQFSLCVRFGIILFSFRCRTYTKNTRAYAKRDQTGTVSTERLASRISSRCSTTAKNFRSEWSSLCCRRYRPLTLIEVCFGAALFSIDWTHLHHFFNTNLSQGQLCVQSLNN